MQCRIPRLARAGFTIVELMIVVSIIAVLMSLTLYVVGAFVTQAREAATQATVRKIHGLLNSRSQALQRITMRTGFLTSTPEYNDQTVRALANGDVNLQKILAVKELGKTYFPQRQIEVLINMQPKIFNASDVQSSEIMYDFLTQSNVLGDQPPGADAFSTSEVGDKDGDGLPEFFDAWGNPLRFYRWPTRLFRPNGYGDIDTPNQVDPQYARLIFSTLPSDLSRDPDDPLRRCAAFNQQPPASNDFELVGPRGGYHTPGTYHVLLVVSAGPDGALGLFEPEDTANNGHLAAVSDPDALADDITYLGSRVGGK